MTSFFKKSVLGFTLFSASQFALANAQTELQKRLDLVSQYSADFDQTVRSSKGKEIQKGKGKFYVKRPNLFRMETKTPQENLVISDGKTLWFYDPFVAQVSANWVKDAVNNTPFVLITSNEKSHWDQYEVKQTVDSFTLKPKSKKSTIKQFDININADGLLKGFSIIERDGQSNLYVLRNISNVNLSADLFKFDVPKGVELDDQRGK